MKTKQDYIDVLTHFRDYTSWMYYSEGGIEAFNRQVLTDEFSGDKYTIKIQDDGDYILKHVDSGIEAIFKAFAFSSPLRSVDNQKTLENYSFKALFVNENDVPEEKREFFERISITCLSAFQRVLCFTYFCRMRDETIENIANDLFKSQN